MDVGLISGCLSKSQILCACDLEGCLWGFVSPAAVSVIVNIPLSPIPKGKTHGPFELFILISSEAFPQYFPFAISFIGCTWRSGMGGLCGADSLAAMKARLLDWGCCCLLAFRSTVNFWSKSDHSRWDWNLVLVVMSSCFGTKEPSVLSFLECGGWELC